MRIIDLWNLCPGSIVMVSSLPFGPYCSCIVRVGGLRLRSPQIYLPGVLSMTLNVYFVSVHPSPGGAGNMASPLFANNLPIWYNARQCHTKGRQKPYAPS